MFMPQPEYLQHLQHLQPAPPRRRRLLIILVGVSGLLLAGVIVELPVRRGAFIAPTHGPMAPPTVPVADRRPAPRPLNGVTRATAEVRGGELVVARTCGPGTHFGVLHAGFPEADWSWTDHPHDRNDAALDLFTSEP